MRPDLQQLMRDMRAAGGLMRAGDLQGATASIQAALRGQSGTPGEPNHVQTTRHDDPREDGVIDVVARELSPAAAAAREAPPTGDTPERFIAGSHGTASMRRAYKLYIPPNARGRSLPLVVMLHGCTQDPDDFALGTGMNALARTEGFFVLYPAQSQQANPQRCWNWFKHSHQQRGRGEPALIAGMARAVIAEHGIDERRVYVAGLSAGGAMAAILGSTYPDVFAAVGVHSGLAAAAAHDLPSALTAMRSGSSPTTAAPTGMPTIVFHGDADSTVNAANATAVVAASAGVEAAAEVREVRGAAGAHPATVRIFRDAQGHAVVAQWTVHGASHAWSGGNARGSFSDPRGPDASAEMLRFFLDYPLQLPRACGRIGDQKWEDVTRD